MKNLAQVADGANCTVTWMIGQTAEAIRDFCKISESDCLHVISNAEGYVVVSHHGKTFALDPLAASAIKVEVA